MIQSQINTPFSFLLIFHIGSIGFGSIDWLLTQLSSAHIYICGDLEAFGLVWFGLVGLAFCLLACLPGQREFKLSVYDLGLMRHLS